HRRTVPPQPLVAQPPRAPSLDPFRCLTFGDRSLRLDQRGSGTATEAHGCSLRPGRSLRIPEQAWLDDAVLGRNARPGQGDVLPVLDREMTGRQVIAVIAEARRKFRLPVHALLASLRAARVELAALGRQ